MDRRPKQRRRQNFIAGTLLAAAAIAGGCSDDAPPGDPRTLSPDSFVSSTTPTTEAPSTTELIRLECSVAALTEAATAQAPSAKITKPACGAGSAVAGFSSDELADGLAMFLGAEGAWVMVYVGPPTPEALEFTPVGIPESLVRDWLNDLAIERQPTTTAAPTTTATPTESTTTTTTLAGPSTTGPT